MLLLLFCLNVYFPTQFAIFLKFWKTVNVEFVRVVGLSCTLGIL